MGYRLEVSRPDPSTVKAQACLICDDCRAETPTFSPRGVMVAEYGIGGIADLLSPYVPKGWYWDEYRGICPECWKKG